MPYRPREIVVRAREAASLLLAALDHNGMVPRFLELYAAEHHRPGRADQPALYRHQMETVRREAILALALRIEAALPARLQAAVRTRSPKRPPMRRKGKAKTGPRTAKKKNAPDLTVAFLDLFREEFFVALGQALDWTDADAHEFWRDLELCRKLLIHEPRRSSGYLARPGASGPFVDRVALLLDPSLMEQARRAAAKFQVELNATADRTLRTVFSRRGL